MATYTIDKFTYNNNTYNLQDAGALQLTGGQVTGPVSFGDAVTIDEATVGDLLVTGAASFTNTINGYTLADQTISSSSTHGSIPTSKAVYDYIGSQDTLFTRGTGVESIVAITTPDNSLGWEANTASGDHSFAGGSGSSAENWGAFAFGYGATASGTTSFAFGGHNQNVNNGNGPIASGAQSMAVGTGAVASGVCSISLGQGTAATDGCAVAMGNQTQATAKRAVAFGDQTIASGRSAMAIGAYNIEDTNTTDFTSYGTGARQYLFTIGNGTSTSNRSNAFTVDWTGAVTAAGKITAGAAPVNNMDVATKQYVDELGIVQQSATNTSNWRKVLLHHTASSTINSAVTDDLDVVYGSQYIEAKPSAGLLKATNYFTTSSTNASDIGHGYDFVVSDTDTPIAHIGASNSNGVLGLYASSSIKIRPNDSNFSGSTGISISDTLIDPAVTNFIDLGSSSNKFKDLYLAGQGNATTFKSINVIAAASSNNLTAGAGFEIYNSTPTLRASLRAGANVTTLAGTGKVVISPSVDTADNAISFTSTSITPYTTTSTISLGTSSYPFDSLYISDTDKTANNLEVLYMGKMRDNDIASNTDLNTITTGGTYRVTNSTIAASLSNAPITLRGFTLYVFEGYSTYDTYQIVATYGQDNIFYRMTTNNDSSRTWSPWHKLRDNADIGFCVGNCTTAEATTSKIVTTTTGTYQLNKYGIVVVSFSNNIPANSTLSIDGQTAKPIHYHGAAITDGIINAGDRITFIYDGSYYVMLAKDTMTAVSIVRW